MTTTNNFKHPVVFIRHGQTQWNLEKRTQGHYDSSLTELGRRQAQEVAQKIKKYPFDLVISSPLGRALETAQIIIAELKIQTPIQIHHHLAERNLGVLQGLTHDESIRLFPACWDSDSRFIQNCKIPGGESFDDFSDRIRKVAEEIAALAQEKQILAVTHDGVLHAITSYLKGISLDEVQKHYVFHHGEPVIFE